MATSNNPSLGTIFQTGFKLARNVCLVGLLETKSASMHFGILLSLIFLISMVLFSFWLLALIALCFYLRHTGTCWTTVTLVFCSGQLILALLLSGILCTFKKRSLFPATIAAMSQEETL